VPSQAAAGGRQKRERGSIDPEEILDGAFELVEELSVDNLSMPALAKHLGVGVTSIYWYFRRKNDLLDAMTDRAWSKYKVVEPPIDPADWRQSLADNARWMRRKFLRSPILTDLILIRGRLGPQSRQRGLEEMESAVAALVQVGLSHEDAFDTYAAVSVLIRGSVVMERLYQKTRELEHDEPFAGRQSVVDPAATPLIARMMGEGHRIGAADSRNFEYGLECILDHAERLIEDRKTVESRKKPAARRGRQTATPVSPTRTGRARQPR